MQGGWGSGREQPAQQEYLVWTLYEEKVSFYHVKPTICWCLCISTANTP
jgi:hypothetical protein